MGLFVYNNQLRPAKMGSVHILTCKRKVHQWTKGQVPKFENKKKNSGLKEVVCVMHKI